MYHPPGPPDSAHSRCCQDAILTDDAYTLQRLRHGQTDAQQLWHPVKEGGHYGITKTNQVAIYPQQLVLSVLLGHLLVNDECVDVSPLREGVNTRLCRRVKVSLKLPKLGKQTKGSASQFEPHDFVHNFEG